MSKFFFWKIKKTQKINFFYVFMSKNYQNCLKFWMILVFWMAHELALTFWRKSCIKMVFCGKIVFCSIPDFRDFDHIGIPRSLYMIANIWHSAANCEKYIFPWNLAIWKAKYLFQGIKCPVEWHKRILTTILSTSKIRNQ